MDMLALIAALTIMGAIVTGLVAVYQSTASPRSSMERRLGNLLSDSNGLEATASDFEALRPRRAGKLPLVSALLEGRSWTSDMAMQLERADIGLTVGEFVSLRIFLTLGVGGMLFLLFSAHPVGWVIIVAGAAVSWFIPGFYVNYSRNRRLKKLNDQLVEALSMIANSLKAGFGLMQSLDLAARELSHPIATELRHAMTDINVGAGTDEALQNMAKRSGSPDMDIVVTAMLVQQSTGGNLAEILDNVGHTMRERIRIRGEITTLTTQQMMTGLVIGVLPVAIAGAIFVINPDYIRPLYTNIAGQLMLGGAILMESFGIFLIKRILAIEV